MARGSRPLAANRRADVSVEPSGRHGRRERPPLRWNPPDEDGCCTSRRACATKCPCCGRPWDGGSAHASPGRLHGVHVGIVPEEAGGRCLETCPPAPVSSRPSRPRGKLPAPLRPQPRAALELPTCSGTCAPCMRSPRASLGQALEPPRLLPEHRLPGLSSHPLPEVVRGIRPRAASVEPRPVRSLSLEPFRTSTPEPLARISSWGAASAEALRPQTASPSRALAVRQPVCGGLTPPLRVRSCTPLPFSRVTSPLASPQGSPLAARQTSPPLSRSFSAAELLMSPDPIAWRPLVPCGPWQPLGSGSTVGGGGLPPAPLPWPLPAPIPCPQRHGHFGLQPSACAAEQLKLGSPQWPLQPQLLQEPPAGPPLPVGPSAGWFLRPPSSFSEELRTVGAFTALLARDALPPDPSCQVPLPPGLQSQA